MMTITDLSESKDYGYGYCMAKLDAIKGILKSAEIKYSEDRLRAIKAILNNDENMEANEDEQGR